MNLGNVESVVVWRLDRLETHSIPPILAGGPPLATEVVAYSAAALDRDERLLTPVCLKPAPSTPPALASYLS